MAVVDAFDAMTTNRAYRRPRTPPRPFEELHRCAGTHFDPEVVSTRSPARFGDGSPRFPSAAEPVTAPTMSDTLMISVSGMRGHVGTDLTPELVARYAAALGAWVRSGGADRRAARPAVVLGRDARTSGPMFARAATAGSHVGGGGRHGPRHGADAHGAAGGRAPPRRRRAHPDGEPQPDRVERAQVRRAGRDLPRRRGGRAGAGAGGAGAAASRVGRGRRGAGGSRTPWPGTSTPSWRSP